jgi:hypothetical protein
MTLAMQLLHSISLPPDRVQYSASYKCQLQLYGTVDTAGPTRKQWYMVCLTAVHQAHNEGYVHLITASSCAGGKKNITLVFKCESESAPGEILPYWECIYTTAPYWL